MVLILTLLLFVTGCTDAQLSKFSSLGDSQHIICYSGGKVILDDHSTGVVENEQQSDGWYFKSRNTNKIVRVGGDCIIVD